MYRFSIPRSPVPQLDRLGYTLMELTVVMALLGLIAVAATSMLGSSRVTSSLLAQQEARHLQSALRTARATAISNSTGVQLQAVVQGSSVRGFRTTSSVGQILQPEHSFPEQLQVRWSAPAVVFDPTGMSSVALQAEIESESALWELVLFPGSGQTTLTRIR